MNLGTIYDQGIGVIPDRNKAVGWWKKAAASGNTVAQEMLRRVQDENDVLEILERLKVPAEVKADAWDAYCYSPNETSFTERMKKLTLPEDIKVALWDRRWANKQPQPK